MLAEMRDSQTPPISSFKSPLTTTLTQKTIYHHRNQPPSVSERKQVPRKPAQTSVNRRSQPPGPNTEAGFSNLRNRVANLESTRAKSRKSNMVLKDHAKKGISPIGLKYQPRPHLRPDHVSERSVPELRTGPPQPHDSEQLKKNR